MVTIINNFCQAQTQHNKSIAPFHNQEHEKETTEKPMPASKVGNRYSINKAHLLLRIIYIYIYIYIYIDKPNIFFLK